MLPLAMLAIPLAGQVIGGIFGMIQQNKMNEQTQQALKMQQQYQQQQNQMLSQFMGGGAQGGYPQMQA